MDRQQTPKASNQWAKQALELEPPKGNGNLVDQGRLGEGALLAKRK